MRGVSSLRVKCDNALPSITTPCSPTSTVTLDSVSYTTTVTVGVCEPAQKNGLNYSAGYSTYHASPFGSQYGDPSDPQHRKFIDYPPVTTLQQCCQYCFRSLECYSFSHERYASNSNDLRCSNSNNFHGSGYCPRLASNILNLDICRHLT